MQNRSRILLYAPAAQYLDAFPRRDETLKGPGPGMPGEDFLGRVGQVGRVEEARHGSFPVAPRIMWPKRRARGERLLHPAVHGLIVASAFRRPLCE